MASAGSIGGWRDAAGHHHGRPGSRVRDSFRDCRLRSGNRLAQAGGTPILPGCRPDADRLLLWRCRGFRHLEVDQKSLVRAGAAGHHHVRLERGNPGCDSPAKERGRRSASDCCQLGGWCRGCRTDAPGLRAVLARAAPADAHCCYVRSSAPLSACCSIWVSESSSTNVCSTSSGSQPLRSASAWRWRGAIGKPDATARYLRSTFTSMLRPAPGRIDESIAVAGIEAAVPCPPCRR